MQRGKSGGTQGTARVHEERRRRVPFLLGYSAFTTVMAGCHVALVYRHACCPPELWLRFRIADPLTDDSSPDSAGLCVDSGLASFPPFAAPPLRRSGSPGRKPPGIVGPPRPSPCHKSPIVSFVDSSMIQLESYSTIGVCLTSAVGSTLSPPDLTRIRHPPSDMRHRPLLLPPSPFRILPCAFSAGFPASAATPASVPTGTAGAARTPGCNPAPRGRAARRPRPPRWSHARPAAPGAGRRAIDHRADQG